MNHQDNHYIVSCRILLDIYETHLKQNLYTSVKSIHITTKPKYKGEILTKSNINQLAKSPKFHITKKCESLEQIEDVKVEQVAENSVKVNKSVSLEDLFKKFNTK